MDTMVMVYNNYVHTSRVMKTQQIPVALDSCVVIDLIDKRVVGMRIRSKLKGKSIRLILCDKVLSEVQKVRQLSVNKIIELVTMILGRKPEVLHSTTDDVIKAQDLSNQYLECHKGDNLILAFCMARNFILLTFDRMFLKICDIVGVLAFNPVKGGKI